MPKRKDERRDESVEDLFEDLDKFFEPIREPDWPEGEPGEQGLPAPAEGGSAPDEEWPQIAVPDEAELLGAAEGEAAPPDEGRDLTVDDLKKAPPQYVDLPRQDEAAEGDQERPEAAGTDETAGGRRGRRAAKRGGGGRRSRKAAEEAAAAAAGMAGAAGATPEGTEAAGAEPPAREPSEEPAAEETLAGEFGLLEEDVVPELQETGRPSDDDVFESEPAPTEGAVPEAAGPPEEEATPEDVEAAADHFAEALRASPEEVEADLLSDLDAPREEPDTVSIEPPPPVAGTPASGPPSGTSAPTWEEPGIVAAQPEERPPTAVPGRNLVAAFATGAILAVAALALLWWGKGPFAVLASAVILLGQGELYAVLRMRGRNPATALGLVSGAFIVAGGYLAGEPGILLGVVMAMTTSVLWYMAAHPAARKDTTVDVGATLLGVVYVPLMASFALVMLRLPGEIGRNVLLAVIGLTILYDVLAYAVGSLWGNRALAPTISPMKSWEGAVGATLGILLVAIALVPSIQPFTPARAVGLALVVAVFAPLGDLVESALKRDLGVKDMSSILPGHGGILDRVDSILFTAPAAWYFFRLAGLLS